MDDLGDDSVQAAARASRETFEMWQRVSRRDARRGAVEMADGLRRGLESPEGEVRAIDPGEARAARGGVEGAQGWRRVTMDPRDREGIESRLAAAGVEMELYERWDGDVDVLFRAPDEEAVKSALAGIISEEALRDERQAARDPLEKQVAEAVAAEESREAGRTASKSREMSQGIER